MLRSLGIIGVIFLSVALLAGSSSLKNFAALEKRAAVAGTGKESDTSLAGYENIAFQKPATQSSTYSHSANPVANKAVDGNTNGIFNIASTTHTNDDKKAWWEVDLGHQSEISLVSLYNRIDCCKERLTNFQVRLFGNAHSISRKVSQGSTVQNRYDFKFPEKTIARYVRVQLLGKNYLSLAEVEVFGRVLGGYENIAFQKPATQSSTYSHSANPVANKAVDGNTNGIFNIASTTHTNDDKKAWWEVDLGHQSEISFVTLYNRIDCCKERLTNFQVRLFDYAHSISRKVSQRSTVQNRYDFKFPEKTIARYVRVQLLGKNYLSLAEVEVFGRVLGGYENIAFQKPATQSSTYSHSANPVASKAVDGNTNGIFNIASTTHTNDDRKAWWEVDLGHQSEISFVTLYNRIDCCKERLTNFQVRLFDYAHSISRKVSQRSTVQNRYDFKFPEKTIARYVRVQLLGKHYLSLAEVEVFGRVLGGYENIAFQKPATQSSTYSHSANPVANKAVDGNTNGIFNIASTTHTNDDKKAWWEVDLGHQSEISFVTLYNRIDCCKERLTNFQVQLFDYAHSISRKVSQGSTVQNRYDFTFPEKTIARYVRVQLLGKNYLSLAEVEVFGVVLGGYENVAFHKPATQSSTYSHSANPVANKAMDGNTNGIFIHASTTHTNQEAGAWWQVDLGSDLYITAVTIYNRVDCCGDRLQNFDVILRNSHGTAVQRFSHGTGVQAIFVFKLAIPSQARFVKVQLQKTGFLQLAEVQVFSGSKTCSGSAYGGRCYFPFVYQGEKYSSCAAAADTYDGPWCATQKGVVTDESNWGYCLC